MVRSTSQANRSDAVAALLNPTTGIREEQKRKGLKPHDHTRDNKQYIKQLEQLNRAREEVAAAEASTPRKVSSKYKHVSARVMTPRQLERPREPSPGRVPAGLEAAVVRADHPGADPRLGEPPLAGAPAVRQPLGDPVGRGRRRRPPLRPSRSPHRPRPRREHAPR